LHGLKSRLGLDKAGELLLRSDLFGLGGLGLEKLIVIVTAAVSESRETTETSGRGRGDLLLRLLLFGMLSGPGGTLSLLGTPLV